MAALQISIFRTYTVSKYDMQLLLTNIPIFSFEEHSDLTCRIIKRKHGALTYLISGITDLSSVACYCSLRSIAAFSSTIAECK